MKIIRKLVVLVLVVSTLLCNGVFFVSAAQGDDDTAGLYYNPNNSNGRFYFMDASGNGYSSLTFSSLSNAKAYFGYNWTYTDCNVYVGANLYNYFYECSDGAKLYFYVGI